MDNDVFFKPKGGAPSAGRQKPASDKFRAHNAAPIKRKGKPAVAKPSTEKRSRVEASNGPARKKKIADDDEEKSEEEDEERQGVNVRGEVSDEEEEETAAQKRFRIAKQLLLEMEEAANEQHEDAETASSLVKHRLDQELNADTGVSYRRVADKLKDVVVVDSSMIRYRRHKLAVTCVSISADSKFIYSGSKDGSIIKWSTETNKRVFEFPGGVKNAPESHQGHRDHVLALALSTNGAVLASGGKDKVVFVWDVVNHVLLNAYKGHRHWVSGLVFRRNSMQLFSASFDRTVKVWNVEAGGYIETLFGHQDAVMCIDSLEKERAITCGGRDRSARLWKIPEESQLVFAGPMTSMDCIALLDESHFVTGAESGMLSLWDLGRKKSVCSIPEAHGANHWILSLSSLRLADLFASGSNDGFVRLWKCASTFREILPISAINLAGYVNSLSFSSSGNVLVAAVGQEPRLGRWSTTKAAKNAVVIIPLPLTQDD